MDTRCHCMLVSVLYIGFSGALQVYFKIMHVLKLVGIPYLIELAICIDALLSLAFVVLNFLNLVTCMLALLAWSSLLLEYPDPLNLNPSILALSLYSILLLFMTSL